DGVLFVTGAWRLCERVPPSDYCMVFSQQYHAEVSLNIPTRERWTPYTSELSGPTTIAKARNRRTSPFTGRVRQRGFFTTVFRWASRRPFPVTPYQGIRSTPPVTPTSPVASEPGCAWAQPLNPLPRAVAGRPRGSAIPVRQRG